ncbi:uncharacterized protein BX663DRAFT_563218 [Cokeromyces recurvatus]|uniref:uncharacterized protein n=1 Tax=Cokeromyces recurvatus TaxID=90255 RepID=UPI00221F810A|nr:uncharacterized protein BX663DRAFT_563218 [Cokeromyces recurvatus]KAI7900294.1 hypothetical protein BX663DRAFT_563218 [Cokeromyces recurvatus]
MTDNICHSILRTATQQIIHSAGFESANGQSIDTLTDIFGKYIQFLGSTVSAYANLNGRTMGTARDLMEALDEIAVDTNVLKVWLEEDGKTLTPCWSAQSDPSRLLQDVINGGKPTFDDIIEYTFGDVPEFDIPSPSSSPLIDSPSPPPPVVELPDYIPSYFPSFPEVKEDIEIEQVDKIPIQKQQALEKQKQEEQQKQQKPSSAESLPLPVIVKKRKKPIENPFTHIIPFEDSSLALDDEDNQQQPKPLSLSLKTHSHKRKETSEDTLVHKQRKVSIEPLAEALQNVKAPTYKLGEGLRGKEALLKGQTAESAAPGNHLFNHDAGIFDDLVRKVAEPLIVSKLTAPNLLIDIATATSNSAAPAISTLAGFSGLSNEFGSSSSLPTSPDGMSKISRSNSMLAVLAGGSMSTKAAAIKKLSKLTKSNSFSQSIPPSSFGANYTISKNSIDINEIKTGESKYIMKKKRMLAEQQALERQRLLEQQQKENGEMPSNSDSTILLSTTSTPTPPTTTPTSPTSPPSSTTTPTPTTMVNISSMTAATPLHKPQSSISTASAIVTTKSTPTSTITKTGPISLNSFSSAIAASSNTNNISMSSSPSLEKKKKHKKSPHLVLNFSQQNPSSVTQINEESGSLPSTPKIRFKIKPPEQQQDNQTSKSNSPNESSPNGHNSTIVKLEKQQQQQQQQQQPQLRLFQQPQSPAVTQRTTATTPLANGHMASEEIRCICENPTVDYGTFMIACDKCSIWFHGSCVGIAESDHVEEWYCRRCRK